MPKGLGASTLTSTPAGVMKRPFGRIAARKPSMKISRVVGRSPAGARKWTVCDCSCGLSASADQGSAVNALGMSKAKNVLRNWRFSMTHLPSVAVQETITVSRAVVKRRMRELVRRRPCWVDISV